MTQKNESLEIAIQSTNFLEHQCQYKTLLQECAELLSDIHAELGELHYSIYQDDERDDDEIADDSFCELYEDGSRMIDRLKALKILESKR